MQENRMDKITRQLNALSPEKFESGTMDNWVQTSYDDGSSRRRDGFIGNGLIGIRIPVEGQPSVFPYLKAPGMAEGGTLMYGVWDTAELISVFNFMGLELKHGRMTCRRDSGTLLDYCQTLDWRNAAMETSFTWVHWHGEIDVKIKIWLSRAVKNAGCVELKLTPRQKTFYRIIDRVDGHFMPMDTPVKYAVRSPWDLIKTAYAYVGSRQRKLAASTEVSLDGEIIPGDFMQIPGGFERHILLKAEANQTYTIRKVGVLCVDEVCSDPINASATIAAGFMAHWEEHYQKHCQLWDKLYEHRIEVGHPGLQTLINNSLYQIYSNLGEGNDNPPGPCGLTGRGYANRLFHDGEMWTYPPMLLLHPELAANYVNYRFNALPGYQRNAAAHLRDGCQISWESAEFGDEMVPGLVYSTQNHINSDVAFAQWQYYLVTGDKNFLREKAAPIICGSADFWVSRSIYNQEFDRYEIHDVCCVDEAAFGVNNNALTNYGAKVNLELAVKVCQMLDMSIDPRWQQVADKMYIPIDKEKNYIIEHDTYNGENINQADATLTIYPWEMPMDDQCKFNTVEYYRTRYHAQKIMMGSAIDGIIDCELGNLENSWQVMMDLLPHFRGDFLMVSESPYNEKISLITGLGGLLQLVMMGWGGIRIHSDELQAAYRLPAQIPWMRIKGVWHGGKCFDLHYENGKVKRIDR